MAMRPGYGSCGYTTKVQANHFKLQIKVQFQWLTVTFDPPLHTKEEKLEFWESAKGNNDCLTNTYFDGYDKAVVIGEVPTILVFNPTIFNQCKNNLSEKCDVILKVRFGPLSEDDELRAFDLILREKLRSKRLIIDSIFLLPETRIELDKGVQAWTGFRLTSHHTQTGTCLVIDRKTIALFASVVSSHVSQLLPRHNFRFPLADLQRVKLQEKIGRVVYNSRYGRLSVIGLSDKPKQDLRIKFADVLLARDKMGDKVDISADDYFEQSCGFESSSLNGALPVVLVRNRPYYLPMELCVIVKKESYSELNSMQRKSLGGITPPLSKLLDAIREDSRVVSRRMENSHFGIEDPLLTFVARVLPNPQVAFAEGKIIENDTWDIKKVFDGSKVGKGGWVCINHLGEKYNGFCKDLVQKCRDLGMDLDVSPCCSIRCGSSKNISHTLERIKSTLTRENKTSDCKLQVIIIILPLKLTPAYIGELNAVCNTLFGVPMLCCDAEEVIRYENECMKIDIESKKTEPDSVYLVDRALRMNAKLGGTNAIVGMEQVFEKIPSLEDDTVVFGISTSHLEKKSALAVVVSFNWPVLSQYKAAAKLCQGDEYKPEDLLPIIRSLLDELQDSGIRPSRMVFYRDGLRGDGNSVYLEEIDVIKKACELRGIDASITFVVAQRFHNTRLYPTADDALHRNVVQGTVVDTDICHSSQFDFYLKSHTIGEDLDCPTHYSVVVDGIGFSPDAMQLFTYSLCFTHVVCVGSTEIVPPILYGRLAADREFGYALVPVRPAAEKMMYFL